MIDIAIRALCSLTILLAAAKATDAGRGKIWQQHAYEDFAKGESEGVAIGADGVLTLAPALTNLAELDAERIWSLVRNDNGDLYVGTGENARQHPLFNKIDVAIEKQGRNCGFAVTI